MIGLNAQIDGLVPNISAQNSAHVTKLRLGSWSNIVLTAAPKDARIVALKRSGSSKALDLPSREPCRDNSTVRMTSSTVLKWSILVKAVKEVDYSSLPSCLPSRDEG
jgi:hypothetical protein